VSDAPRGLLVAEETADVCHGVGCCEIDVDFLSSSIRPFLTAASAGVSCSPSSGWIVECLGERVWACTQRDLVPGYTFNEKAVHILLSLRYGNLDIVTCTTCGQIISPVYQLPNTPFSETRDVGSQPKGHG
jgi:hypothetical protein